MLFAGTINHLYSNEEFFLFLTEDIFQKVREQLKIHNIFLLTIHKVSANFLKIAI